MIKKDSQSFCKIILLALIYVFAPNKRLENNNIKRGKIMKKKKNKGKEKNKRMGEVGLFQLGKSSG
jgi:hypothetical protein